jgi:anti-sigma regulatory factor (Ser/Thr protein kinase)
LKRSQRQKNKTEKITIVIPSEARHLKTVRSVLESMANMYGYSEKDIHAIELATNEACANIIEHAYKNEPNHLIYIKICCDSEKYQIELTDNGMKVNPQKIKPRKLKDIRPGGLGVHFIRSLMDKVKYDKDYRDGNRLILIKERSKNDDNES